MTWEERLLPGAEGRRLPDSVQDLIASQTAVWEPLRAGVESLARARSRSLSIGTYRLKALHIPHRIRSTKASVDPESVRARPCFLCEGNLPPVQRGVRFDAEHVILCNPFPILADHLTIVRRDHVPQRLSGAIRVMLDLVEALPEYMALYNGAECGASAPDHMHFQACRPDVPLRDELERAAAGVMPGYGRTALVLRQRDPAVLEKIVRRLLERLHAEDPGRPEPMVNVVAFHTGGEWQLVIFPRARHRPDVFHSGELTWSPGAIDLCGVIVLPVDGDLERVTSASIETGFKQVSLAPDLARRLARELERV